MTQTTGFGKGRPNKNNYTLSENPLKDFLNEEKSLDAGIVDAVKNANWLGVEDEASVLVAVHLAKQLLLQENRTHQIAPILISLLGNLGLLYGSREIQQTDLVDDFLKELQANEVASH